nr:YdjY domain-containing protein [Victivallales bacterium]
YKHLQAEVNMEEGELEVLICTPNGREHESLLISEIDPFHLQLAMILAGGENGHRISGENSNQGSLFSIDVDTGSARHPIEKWLRDRRSKGERKDDQWVFVGSNFTHDGTCLAKEEGNIANIWSFGNTILDNPSEDAIYDDIFEVFSGRLPERGTKLTVHLKLIKK